MPLVANSEAHWPGISRIQRHLLETIDPSTSFDRRQDSVIVSRFLRPADVTVKSTPNDAMMLESLRQLRAGHEHGALPSLHSFLCHTGTDRTAREKPQQY